MYYPNKKIQLKRYKYCSLFIDYSFFIFFLLTPTFLSSGFKNSFNLNDLFLKQAFSFDKINSPPSQSKNNETNNKVNQKTKAKKSQKNNKDLNKKSFQEEEKEWELPGILYVKNKDDLKKSNFFQSSLILSHYVGVKEDTDPFSLATLEGTYNYKKIHTFGISQSFTKLYIIDGEENEVQLADLQLFYRHKLNPTLIPTYGWSIYPTFRTSLPFSNHSRRQGILSKFSTSLFFVKSFFSRKFTLSVAPTTDFYWNQYKTTVSNPGDQGGTPLMQYRLGIKFNTSLKLINHVRFNISTAWTRNYYETPKFKNAFDPYGNETHPPNHSYSFTPSLSYQWQKMSFYLGFLQSNFAEVAGHVQVVLLDLERSQYFISFRYDI